MSEARWTMITCLVIFEPWPSFSCVASERVVDFGMSQEQSEIYLC